MKNEKFLCGKKTLLRQSAQLAGNRNQSECERNEK